MLHAGCECLPTPFSALHCCINVTNGFWRELFRSRSKTYAQLDMPPYSPKVISTALRRGLRKRCPHCGEGRLFRGWVHLERCSICGLVFARNPGDTWAFTIFGDRLPIAAMIVLIYFGVLRSHRVLGLAMLVLLAGLVVWTAPNRWGVGIALHYLSRVYWPDPADAIPPPAPVVAGEPEE
jgi:uncharacterized protein (DUF983 family)